MVENLKKMMGLAKDVLHRDKYRALKRVKGSLELSHVLKYALISEFRIIYDLLESKLKLMESAGLDAFFLRNKLVVIPSKIKYLSVHFSIEGANMVYQHIKMAEEEVKEIC